MFPPLFPSLSLLPSRAVSPDINITFDNNVLRIDAERKEETKEEKERFHFTERRWGRTSRSIRLPSDVNEENVSATYMNGVLQVNVPKKEEPESKRRQIKVA